MVRRIWLLLFFSLVVLSLYQPVYASCPTSILEVSPQPVQPGQPIKLTFPWDRANNIEDNTSGGLQQEAGHVDNTSGGSIHFQNGSNNWYIFHAGPTCGTYTWNHQSDGCYTSIKFNVCGSSVPTQAATPTPEPKIIVDTPPPPIIIPTEPSQPIDIPTVVPSRFFTIPTVSSLQTTSPVPVVTEQSTQLHLPIPSFDISKTITSIGNLGNNVIAQVKSAAIFGKDFFMNIITAFLKETTF